LRLKVIAGHHLAKKDIFGASDPYVRVDLNTINGDQTVDSALTRTKKKTLNPVWEEEFVFRVNRIVEKCCISFLTDMTAIISLGQTCGTQIGLASLR